MKVNWFEYALLTVWIGFAVLIFTMTGCAGRKMTRSELIDREYDSSRYRIIVTSGYNWDVVKLVDDLILRVKSVK